MTKKKFSFLAEEDNVDFYYSRFQKDKEKKLSEKDQLNLSLNFEKVARYRCSQINITKVLDEITFSLEIKTQYLLSTAFSKVKYFHVKLEDYICSIDPQVMEYAFQITEPLEFIRHNVKFTQNKKGEIIGILNLPNLHADWQNFRDQKLPEIEFYQKIKEQNPKAAEDIITTGNQEFSDEKKFQNAIHKNLFYHIFLKANVGEELEDFTIEQFSQLFPNQKLNTKVQKVKIKETASTIVLKLIGTLQRDSLSEEYLKQQYDEIYKPLIKYSYSEFNYIYRINYTVDAQTGLLLEANAAISEKIKNNYECLTQFQLKKVEL
ncbi:hypothetical protein AAG747_25410 [Rapidithrix thailandica]|uniref:Uncharacterized protein n=1 Tax=Rapidithrix thailandica TaxID=413964 RepID=A0AAW9SE23_9BACT